MAMPKRNKIPIGTKRAVYERDNWTCQYCGLKFDPTQTWSDKTIAPYIRDDRLIYIFLELDHVHPRFHGGGDSADNLKAACTPCNRRKSFNLSRSA